MIRLEIDPESGYILMTGFDPAIRRKLEPRAASPCGPADEIMIFEQEAANFRAIMRVCANKPMLIDPALAFQCREDKVIRLPAELPTLARLKTPQWDHQRPATYLALTRPGLLLSMDMATGKTKVVIDTAQNMPLDHAPRALVVAPKAVVPNWPDEIATHDASGAICIAVDTSKPIRYRVEQVRRALETTPANKPLYVAVTHETVWNRDMLAILLSQPWDVIAVDEAHKMCDPSTKLAQAVYQLAARNPQAKRLALTGTPLRNKALDIYGIAKFVAPDEVPESHYQFQQHYGEFEDMGIWITRNSARELVTVKKFVGLKDEDEFARFLARFTFRVCRDVLEDLPPAIHVRRYADLSADAAREYAKISKGLMAELNGREFAPAEAGVKLMRLSQMTGLAKGAALRELLEELNEPVVVFAHFTEDLAIIRKVCDELNLVYLEQSGARSEWQKFQRGAGNVLGVQEQSGGAGVNLTRARTVIYYSYGHSFTAYDQSLARCRRPGTHRGNVTYIHLLAKNTVDEDAHFALSSGVDTMRYLISKAADAQRAA